MGCGWLGKATAKLLINEGFQVKGSTTTVKGSNKLKALGVEPYVIELTPKNKSENLDGFLSGLQVLVIAIPPKMSENDHLLLEALKPMFKTYDFSGIQKLIYVSSTGVFEDGTNAVYDEDSTPNNSSERGQYLIALEDLIRSQSKVSKTIIIRYGGLFEHRGRHPIHYLSGRKGIQNPDAPINLIEKKDAVRLLYQIVKASEDLKIYHGVCPLHPSRKQYYTQMAKKINLPAPEFLSGKKSLGKVVTSDNTMKTLRFEYLSHL